ncbi:MAG: EthD family reductase, partial [Sphingobacteriales bacterium]
MAGKLSIFFLAFLSIGLLGCKTSLAPTTLTPAAGLYKVAILYPNGDDKTFDMDYYQKKHMPMVAGFLGKNLIFYQIDKGISGRTPTDKAPFVATGYFFVRNIADYTKAIAQNREAIVGDFKNYTTIQPVINISEI